VPLINDDPYLDYQAPFLFEGNLHELNSYFGQEKYKVASLDKREYNIGNVEKAKEMLCKTLFLDGLAGMIRFAQSANQTVGATHDDIGRVKRINTYCNRSISGISVTEV